MFRRLFLIVLCVVTLLSPVVVFAESVEPSSANTSVSLIKEGALCDLATLGVSEDGASVVLRAVWIPKVYRCGQGYYLKKTEDSVDCAICPKDAYCPGFEDHTYTESEYGKTQCETGYYTDSTGSTKQQDCYRTRTVSCAEMNPFSCPYIQSVVYDNPTTTCTEHWGGESVCDSACVITDLVCAPGYKSSHVGNVWSCVEEGVSCEAGKYLPAGANECAVCPADSFCSGGKYTPDNTKNQGIESCDGLKSPTGSQSERDCGKILRVNGEALYLHADKRGPNPSLVVEIDGKKWYANTTPVSQGTKPMSEGSNKTVHMLINGQEYTVHTEIYKE